MGTQAFFRQGAAGTRRAMYWLAPTAAALLAAAAGCDTGDEPRRNPLGSMQRSAGDGETRSAANGQRAEDGAARTNARTDVALGTFRPGDAAALEGAQPQGRLPAEGDRAAYVPAVTLFPGVARIDPNIANPYAGDPEAVAAGERHFAAFNCAGCHAPLGGGGMGPPLSDDTWIHGGEPAQIYLSILHGRADGMPAWSSMLPQRTIWELVAYVESLSEIEDHAARKGFEANPSERFAGGEAETPSEPR